MSVQIASAEAYLRILRLADRNGWRYPAAQIEKGFRRHFEELTLQLVVHGYTIIKVGSGNQKCPLGVAWLTTGRDRKC